MILNRRQILQIAASSPLGRLFAAGIEPSRLGVTTDEIHDDLEFAAGFLKSFRLGYAEIRNIWGKYNTEQPVEEIQRARRILDRYGLKVNVLDTSFFKVPLPAEDEAGHAALQKQWALLDRAMERARLLGTDLIRIFAFNLDKGREPRPGDYQRISELLREAGRRARKANLRLAIENVAGSYVATGADSARMLKTVVDSSVGLTWDPNNAAAAGEDPFPGGYRLLDPVRIFHVHLRDFRRTGAGKVEWCAVGEGSFDNLGQLRALLQDGYKGGFSLETHYKSPLGKEHASRTSLTGLLEVFRKV